MSGLRVQACGDAHLLNFGIYATPERRLVFDVNDFDETLPAPFEWDVKRLAASVAVAARSRGFAAQSCKRAARAAAMAYRTRIAELAQMGHLEVWYAGSTWDDWSRWAQDAAREAGARVLACARRERRPAPGSCKLPGHRRTAPASSTRHC